MDLTAAKPVIFANNLTKSFSEGNFKIEVLKQLNFTVNNGEMVAILGPSGSGKSTLLHLLGGLDQPSSGKVEINGVDIYQLSTKEQSFLRNRYLGFIYQFHHLLPEFSALENVAMPLLIRGDKIHTVRQKSREILALVGLSRREGHRLGELSGGERQRVAIARALVTGPKCVLADEPTGNLDHKSAEQIYELIFKLNSELHTAFVIVTHDSTIADRISRLLVLTDGGFADSRGD